VPIVQLDGGDPTEIGLANSLARPGGNVTRISQRSSELPIKRVELLSATLPNARRREQSPGHDP
jgi:putative ABC transport system substrate-binding protein